jgi:hypothetical protein
MIYTILSLMVVILGFTTYNLLTKIEKAEDIISTQQDYIDKVTDAIDYSNIKLTEIDHKGSFEADDEIGWFFKEIKNLQTLLNEFNNKRK